MFLDRLKEIHKQLEHLNKQAKVEDRTFCLFCDGSIEHGDSCIIFNLSKRIKHYEDQSLRYSGDKAKRI